MQKVSPFLSLRVSHFRNYLFGAFISEIGNQMQTVAVAWQIYELTRNPAALGLIGVANIIPILLFSLVGGLAADKVDRRKLLILSQSASAILAITLFSLTALRLINPLEIYTILVLAAISGSFSLPARQGVIPNLVPKKYFANAISLQTLQNQSASLIGPALAGILIATLGLHTVYLFNTISYLVFIGIILFIQVPLNINSTKVEFNTAAILQGVKFVFKTPILYSTMVLDFLATFFGTADMLMPIFAKDILKVGAQGLGILYSAPAIGGIIAGLLISMFHSRIKNQGKVILVSIIIYGFATIGFGLSKVFPISIFFLVMVGFGDMVSTIMRNTIRQLVTPDHLRGRMVSILRIFFQGGPQLGEIEAGFLAKAIGGPASVVIGGIGTVLMVSLLAWRNKALREYQGKDLNV